MTNGWGNNETVADFIFLGSKITTDSDCNHETKRCFLLGKEAITNLDSILKAETLVCQPIRPILSNCGFSSCREWIWELDYKESWVLKNWCFWTVVLEKTLESSLDCKEIQPVHPKGNQSWIFIERTDAEAETPILDVKNWLFGKDHDAGKDWRQEEKGMTEDEMVGWHHRLSEHESEQALGVGGGNGSLACCSPWGGKELDMTEWLNWTEMIFTSFTLTILVT